MDEAVSDVFGFHALQLGLPGLHGLRANRMPHRWLACSAAAAQQGDAGVPVSVHCEYDALPFPSQSLDLVVMPHTLELSRDPHLALREAIARLEPGLILQTIRITDRALRQAGIAQPRIAVAGLNPHAGENGLFGREEIDLIAPAIASRMRGSSSSRSRPSGGR